MAKAKKVYTNAILGPFVFAHVHLSSPDTQGQYADNKYKVDGVGDPGSDVMKAAEAKILEAIKACGLKPKGLNTPLKKQTEKDASGKKVDTGKLFIRAKSNRAPVIVDASGNPIPAKALKKLKIGAGSEGLIEGYFTDYETTERVKNAATGEVEVETIKGISFTLTGIQLLKYVKAQSQGGFGAYNGGGFVYDGDDDDDEDEGDNSSGGLDIGDDSDDDDDEGGLDI